MAITLWPLEAVEETTRNAYAKDDVELVELMLMSLAHAHSLAEEAGEQAIHNTITVARCVFEAIGVRWLLDPYAVALKGLIEEANDAR